jgi:hypothetical protein
MNTIALKAPLLSTIMNSDRKFNELFELFRTVISEIHAQKMPVNGMPPPKYAFKMLQAHFNDTAINIYSNDLTVNAYTVGSYKNPLADLNTAFVANELPANDQHMFKLHALMQISKYLAVITSNHCKVEVIRILQIWYNMVLRDIKLIDDDTPADSFIINTQSIMTEYLANNRDNIKKARVNISVKIEGAELIYAMTITNLINRYFIADDGWARLGGDLNAALESAIWCLRNQLVACKSVLG